MTKKLLGGVLLIAGLCSLTTGCSKAEVEAAGDKAGAMAGDAQTKAAELKDQFAAWVNENQGTLDEKLAQLKAKSAELGGEAGDAKAKLAAGLEQRVADTKAMLAGWRDVSADKWAEWSAKAKDTVAKLKADLQAAIDG